MASLSHLRNAVSGRYSFRILFLLFLILFVLYYSTQLSRNRKDMGFTYIRETPSKKGPQWLSDLQKLPRSGRVKIPKIIHQTWRTENIPEKYIPRIRSWVEKHPDWEYWFWTDEDARKFIKDRYPSYLELFDNYPIDIERVDMLRYFLLHAYGGVYADLDMECINPLDPLFYEYSCVLSREPRAHPVLDTNMAALVCNALMACRPGHVFFRQLIENAKLFSHLHSAMDRSGPHFVNINYEMYKKHHNNKTDIDYILRAPPEFFMMTVAPDKIPLYRKKCEEKKLSPQQREVCAEYERTGFGNYQSTWSFTIHHWEHAWDAYRFLNLLHQRQTPISQIVPRVKRYKPRPMG